MRVLIVVAVVATACGRGSTSDGGVAFDAGSSACDAVSCAAGCCDVTQRCLAGDSRERCGSGGAPCSDCSALSSTAWCSAARRCDDLDGGCHAQSVPGAASWATGSCPDGGCPSGSFCLLGGGESSNTFGCAPLATACNGTPSCACMGCLCALGCHDSAAGPWCENGTISQRAAKVDVTYLTADEQRALAREALSISLARYRYRGEPPGARRRLGFLIDDQPNPSPAVQADRAHVDEYGYTSLLLVTIQEQQKEIAELRRRIELLERKTPAAR